MSVEPLLIDLSSMPVQGSVALCYFHKQFNLKMYCSNPLKMGVPKRIASLSSQLESAVFQLGGRKNIHR